MNLGKSTEKISKKNQIKKNKKTNEKHLQKPRNCDILPANFIVDGKRVGARPLLYFARILRRIYAVVWKGIQMLGTLEPLLTPVVNECGAELYDIEFVKEGGNRILRLFIDKDGGVDLNDCERVSHAVSAVLDEHDPIESAYRLQVGSPGIERRLVKPEHFTRYIGRKVIIKLFAPHSPQNPDENESVTTGRKKFTGVLIAYDGQITLKDEEGLTWSFEKKQVSACRLAADL